MLRRQRRQRVVVCDVVSESEKAYNNAPRDRRRRTTRRPQQIRCRQTASMTMKRRRRRSRDAQDILPIIPPSKTRASFECVTFDDATTNHETNVSFISGQSSSTPDRVSEKISFRNDEINKHSTSSSHHHCQGYVSASYLACARDQWHDQFV